ncbi:hypothetical protein AOLI_G00061660 [Acnodon oligacanthus]
MRRPRPRGRSGDVSLQWLTELAQARQVSNLVELRKSEHLLSVDESEAQLELPHSQDYERRGALAAQSRGRLRLCWPAEDEHGRKVGLPHSALTASLPLPVPLRLHPFHPPAEGPLCHFALTTDCLSERTKIGALLVSMTGRA